MKRPCGCPIEEVGACQKPLWMHLDLAKCDPFSGTFGHPEWARGRRARAWLPRCFYCGALVSDRGQHYRTHAIPGARFAILGAYAEILAEGVSHESPRPHHGTPRRPTLAPSLGTGSEVPAPRAAREGSAAYSPLTEGSRPETPGRGRRVARSPQPSRLGAAVRRPQSVRDHRKAPSHEATAIPQASR